MPPKKKFSKRDIIDTAFEIAKQEGLEGITAREIADKLGSSVAPIYVNFSDIEGVKRAVIRQISKISRNMLKKEYTGDRFLDIGIASLQFAKKYSVLFRELVFNENNYMEEYQEEIAGDLLQEMSNDPELKDFDDQELAMILLKMQVFQLGLSVMIANKMLPDEFDDQKQIELLASMGGDIITSIRDRK